jgi:opacity protein-like surface antigen
MGPLKLRFDFDYSQHDVTVAALESGAQAANTEVDYGTGTIFGASGNLVYYIPVVYGVRAYAIAGVGVYHARTELDQGLPFYGGYGFGYGYGYGYGGVDVASHSATNVGWNGGAGIEFALPYGNSWFLESRYHHLGSIEYLPVEIGFRF